VVLDPPRSGAGAKVMDSIAKLSPRSVIYVACDPAALARDTHLLQTHTYKLDALRAFDLFPMTQHIECVARFIKP
jgi:tRNA/tmRNA/rRNA uracil-C5-methylase (TrmA/RlmC/RlmD family)